jgi:hypothetical protein
MDNAPEIPKTPHKPKLPHDPNLPDPQSDVRFFQIAPCDWVTDFWQPSGCPKYCYAIATLPKSSPPSKQTDDAGDAQKGEHLPRGLNMDKNYLDTLDYEKDLAEITCGCGHGYFKPDKTWVSGADVRAGVAPPKPQ